MTNVSYDLTASHRTQLNLQLASLFSSDVKKNNLLLEAVLTESEQVMLVKRVAAVLMLNADYSKYRIAKTLLLSESTIKRYSKDFYLGNYDALLTRTQGKAFNSQQFWELVETLLRAGLPPIVGPGRWKMLSPVANTRPKLR